jgi:hypothetical protein
MVRLFVIASLLLAGCSSAFIPTARRPDGGWHLRCAGSLEQCVHRADDLCKSRGYVVLSGMSTRKLYGAELGVSQVEVREAELDIACADRRGDLPTVVYPSAPTTATAPVALIAPAAAIPPAPVVASPAAPTIAPAAPTIAPAAPTPSVAAPAPTPAPAVATPPIATPAPVLSSPQLAPAPHKP